MTYLKSKLNFSPILWGESQRFKIFQLNCVPEHSTQFTFSNVHIRGVNECLLTDLISSMFLDFMLQYTMPHSKITIPYARIELINHGSCKYA